VKRNFPARLRGHNNIVQIEASQSLPRHFQQARRPILFAELRKDGALCTVCLTILPRKAQWPLKPCSSFVESV
jgi:hypothetical protein